MTPFGYAGLPFERQSAFNSLLFADYTSSAMFNVYADTGIYNAFAEHCRREERKRDLTRRVGAWFQKHYQRRRVESGVFAAAKQLRKQGVPLEIALLLLTR